MAYAQPYGATSPIVGHTPSTPFPQITPQQAARIEPGSITYTTSVGPDGQVTYHPFKAVAASYQTAQGIVNGIQWIPAEATSVVPANATPAGADFAASFRRRDDDYRRKDNISRNSVRYDRDRRDRYDDDDDDYYRRRDRDRDDEDRDFARARDRDSRRLSSYGGAGRIPGDYDKYDKYDRDAAELERRMRDVDLDHRDRERDRDREYERERERERDRTARSRRGSFYGGGERPASTYQPSTGGTYGAAPYGGSTAYAAAPGGAYPSSPRPGDIVPPRPVSPYRTGSVSSPYQAPIAPRPVSPYQAGAVPRAASPFQAAAIQRAASPYGAGVPIQRAASPYGAPPIQRAASPYGAPPIQRAASPYGAPPIQRAASPYGGGGAARGASPYASAVQLPGGGVYGAGVFSHTHSRAPSPSPYGGAGNVYATPQMSSIYGGAQPAAYGSQAGGGAYGGGAGISAHASPRIGAQAIDPMAQGQQAMLTVPEGFARPPNRAQPYTLFEVMKIQDMDDFLDVIPRMPAVLVPHDVYHEDWIRLMQDLAMAWAGTLPVPQYSSDGRPPKRSTLAADVIDLWNASFFRPRGVEMVLYKGRERRSGRLAGTVDMNLPGFDEYDVSSPSDSGGDDADSAEERHRERYGAYGGVYGRQAEAELREARRARRERKAERRKRKMEKKIRKRAKELDRTYAVYLQCIPPHEAL